MTATRPCSCGKITPGRPRGSNECLLCWLWVHRPEKVGNPAPAVPVVPYPPPRPIVSTRPGPGDMMKSILTNMGLTPGGCQCEDRAQQMNRWGVAGCRANRQVIVNWLKEEAALRTWKEKLTAAAHAALGTAGFRPSVTDPLGSIVDESIRRADYDVPPFVPEEDDPAAGVVLGFSRWPELIDLQLAVIKETCGPVPVLVSADPDPTRPGDSSRLAAVCRHRGADLEVSPVRIGHTGGDLAAFYRGVRWGAARNLSAVAKLSQRFVVTRPRWIQDGTKELLLSGLATGARQGTGTRGEWNNQFRTESILMNVGRWNTPAVLGRLEPRKRHDDRPGGYHAESQVLDLIRDEFGAYWPWSLIPVDRYSKSDGIVWRMANTRADYDALARRHGIVLPPDFKVEGWDQELKKGEYDRG